MATLSTRMDAVCQWFMNHAMSMHVSLHGNALTVINDTTRFSLSLPHVVNCSAHDRVATAVYLSVLEESLNVSSAGNSVTAASVCPGLLNPIHD